MNVARDYDLDLGSRPNDLTGTDDLPIFFRLLICWLTYYQPVNFQVVPWPRYLRPCWYPVSFHVIISFPGHTQVKDRTTGENLTFLGDFASRVRNVELEPISNCECTESMVGLV